MTNTKPSAGANAWSSLWPLLTLTALKMTWPYETFTALNLTLTNPHDANLTRNYGIEKVSHQTLAPEASLNVFIFHCPMVRLWDRCFVTLPVSLAFLPESSTPYRADGRTEYCGSASKCLKKLPDDRADSRISDLSIPVFCKSSQKNLQLFYWNFKIDDFRPEMFAQMLKRRYPTIE